jgi:ABC-type Na+ efflux pump permease subunit
MFNLNSEGTSMKKLSVNRLSKDSDNSLKTLADVTEKLSHGRSDGVAITGIVGIVLAFMMLILVFGLVVYGTNQNSKSNPQNNSQFFSFTNGRRLG